MNEPAPINRLRNPSVREPDIRTASSSNDHVRGRLSSPVDAIQSSTLDLPINSSLNSARPNDTFRKSIQNVLASQDISHRASTETATSDELAVSTRSELLASQETPDDESTATGAVSSIDPPANIPSELLAWQDIPHSASTETPEGSSDELAVSTPSELLERPDSPVDVPSVELTYPSDSATSDNASVTVHFDRSPSKPDFTKLSGLIDTLSGKDIFIHAHTDDHGSSEYNMMLSQLRAYEALDYLVTAGIPKDRITARAFGECCAAVPNTTPSNRALNRRVEIRASY